MKKAMKMSVKTYLLAAAGTILSVAAYAQQENPTIERQVEVSRQYAPEVRQAHKLYVIPNMMDTASLRPDYEYSIFPKAWATGFGVEAINPARIYASDFARRYPFYVKLGGGFPGQSVFDLYGVSTNTRGGSYGVYANHYGQYDKREDDYGVKAKNGFMTNDFGVFGTLRVGQRTQLSGELGMEYNTWDRAAEVVSYNVPTPGQMDLVKSDVSTYKYFVPKARIEFGNDFKDLSRFNFSIGADFTHMKEKEQDLKYTQFSVSGKIGRQFDIHQLTLGAKVEMISSEKVPKLRNNIYTLSPSYGITTDMFTLKARVDVVLDIYDDEEDGYDGSFKQRDNDIYALPQLSMTFGAEGSAIVPYIEVDSRLVKNNPLEFMRLNPLASNIPPLENGRSYDLRAGAYGTITPAIGYRIYGGGGLENDIVYFMQTSAETFTGATSLERALSHDVGGKYSRITYFTVGGELETRLGGSFTDVLGAKYNKYRAKACMLGTSEKMSYVFGRPEYEVSLKANYNYNSKFFLRAGVELLGKTRYAFYDYSLSAYTGTFRTEQQSNRVNLSLEAEYFMTPQLGIFLSGSNLLGQDMYYFSNYKDDKMRVNAGVKFLF